MSERSDRYWMARCLRLARPFVADAWPNPAVGCCVVRDGVLLGEGVHRAAGRAHAERDALERLDPGDARGSTLYVNLEPCAHQGRTPACTEAILQAEVRRVVYAARDDNPRVEGGGAARLAAAGVEVEGGVCAAAARELNHRFFESGGGADPHVTLKLALSIDGRLARRRGRVESARERRITGPGAQRRVQRLRRESRAVLVGRRTIEADRPRLDVRLWPEASQPRPVVLDTEAAVDPALLPEGSLVLSVADCERGPEGLAWRSVLAELDRRGLGTVLVEGGARVASTLLAAAPPQRVHLFLAPRLLGADGAALSEYVGPEHGYVTHRVRRLGEDVEWILRRADLSSPAPVPPTFSRP